MPLDLMSSKLKAGQLCSLELREEEACIAEHQAPVIRYIVDDMDQAESDADNMQGNVTHHNSSWHGLALQSPLLLWDKAPTRMPAC